jgi:hypothetical protein
MDITEIGELISKYGFPTVSSFFMLRMVRYVWDFTINEINPVLGEANKELIALIDRIRLCDNDLLRLTAKLNTVLQIREKALLQQDQEEPPKPKRPRSG